MYYLELSNEEMNVLENAIGYRLSELRDEIAHTEDRHYLRSLSIDLENLEKIEIRIRSLVGAPRGISAA